eukprot:gene4974-8568_t
MSKRPGASWKSVIVKKSTKKSMMEKQAPSVSSDDKVSTPVKMVPLETKPALISVEKSTDNSGSPTEPVVLNISKVVEKKETNQIVEKKESSSTKTESLPTKTDSLPTKTTPSTGLKATTTAPRKISVRVNTSKTAPSLKKETAKTEKVLAEAVSVSPIVEQKKEVQIQKETKSIEKKPENVVSMKDSSLSIDSKQPKVRTLSMLGGGKIRKLSTIRAEKKEEQAKTPTLTSPKTVKKSPVDSPSPKSNVLSSTPSLKAPVNLLSPQTTLEESKDGENKSIRRPSISMNNDQSKVKAVKSFKSAHTKSIISVSSISMKKVKSGDLEKPKNGNSNTKSSPRDLEKPNVVSLKNSPRSPRDFAHLDKVKAPRTIFALPKIDGKTREEYLSSYKQTVKMTEYNEVFSVTDENMFVSVFEETKAYESFQGLFDRQTIAFSDEKHNPKVVVLYNESGTKSISTIYDKNKEEEISENIQYGPGWVITENVWLYNDNTKTSVVTTEKSFMVSEIYDRVLDSKYQITLKNQPDDWLTPNEEFHLFNQYKKESKSLYETKQKNESKEEVKLVVNLDFLDDDINNIYQIRQELPPYYSVPNIPLNTLSRNDSSKSLNGIGGSSKSLTSARGDSSKSLQNTGGSNKKLQPISIQLDNPTHDDTDSVPSTPSSTSSGHKKSFMGSAGGLFTNSGLFGKKTQAPITKNRSPSMKDTNSPVESARNAVNSVQKGSFRNSSSNLTPVSAPSSTFTSPRNSLYGDNSITQLIFDQSENPNANVVREIVMKDLDVIDFSLINPITQENGFISVSEEISSYSSKKGHFDRDFNFNTDTQTNENSVIFYDDSNEEINVIELIKDVKQGKTQKTGGISGFALLKQKVKGLPKVESFSKTIDQYTSDDIIFMNPLYDPYAKSAEEMAYEAINHTLGSVLESFFQHQIVLQNEEDDFITCHEEYLMIYEKYEKSKKKAVDEYFIKPKSVSGFSLFGNMDPSKVQLKKTGSTLK